MGMRIVTWLMACTVQDCTTPCNAKQRNAVQCSAAQQSAMQRDTGTGNTYRGNVYPRAAEVEQWYSEALRDPNPCNTEAVVLRGAIRRDEVRQDQGMT